jgi:hypothetical protein
MNLEPSPTASPGVLLRYDLEADQRVHPRRDWVGKMAVLFARESRSDGSSFKHNLYCMELVVAVLVCKASPNAADRLTATISSTK